MSSYRESQKIGNFTYYTYTSLKIYTLPILKRVDKISQKNTLIFPKLFQFKEIFLSSDLLKLSIDLPNFMFLELLVQGYPQRMQLKRRLQSFVLFYFTKYVHYVHISLVVSRHFSSVKKLSRVNSEEHGTKVETVR